MQRCLHCPPVNQYFSLSLSLQQMWTPTLPHLFKQPEHSEEMKPASPQILNAKSFHFLAVSLFSSESSSAGASLTPPETQNEKEN